MRPSNEMQDITCKAWADALLHGARDFIWIKTPMRKACDKLVISDAVKLTSAEFHKMLRNLAERLCAVYRGSEDALDMLEGCRIAERLLRLVMKASPGATYHRRLDALLWACVELDVDPTYKLFTTTLLQVSNHFYPADELKYISSIAVADVLSFCFVYNALAKEGFLPLKVIVGIGEHNGTDEVRIA